MNIKKTFNSVQLTGLVSILVACSNNPIVVEKAVEKSIETIPIELSLSADEYIVSSDLENKISKIPVQEKYVVVVFPNSVLKKNNSINNIYSKKKQSKFDIELSKELNILNNQNKIEYQLFLSINNLSLNQRKLISQKNNANLHLELCQNSNYIIQDNNLVYNIKDSVIPIISFKCSKNSNFNYGLVSSQDYSKEIASQIHNIVIKYKFNFD